MSTSLNSTSTRRSVDALVGDVQLRLRCSAACHARRAQRGRPAKRSLLQQERVAEADAVAGAELHEIAVPLLLKLIQHPQVLQHCALEYGAIRWRRTGSRVRSRGCAGARPDVPQVDQGIEHRQEFDIHGLRSIFRRGTRAGAGVSAVCRRLDRPARARQDPVRSFEQDAVLEWPGAVIRHGPRRPADRGQEALAAESVGPQPPRSASRRVDVASDRARADRVPAGRRRARP